MATYLKSAVVTDVYTFVQFSGTVSALQTALNAALGGTTVQTFADGVTSGNALIVHNNVVVFSVAPNFYIGYNHGQWEVKSAAKMAGGANTDYTPYTP